MCPHKAVFFVTRTTYPVRRDTLAVSGWWVRVGGIEVALLRRLGLEHGLYIWVGIMYSMEMAREKSGVRRWLEGGMTEIGYSQVINSMEFIHIRILSFDLLRVIRGLFNNKFAFVLFKKFVVSAGPINEIPFTYYWYWNTIKNIHSSKVIKKKIPVIKLNTTTRFYFWWYWLIPESLLKKNSV